MVVCSIPDSTVLAVVIQPGSLFNPKGNKLIRVYDWKSCKCLQTIDTGMYISSKPLYSIIPCVHDISDVLM